MTYPSNVDPTTGGQKAWMGAYYQWGRNDDVTSGTWTPWTSGQVSAGAFNISTLSTGNNNLYGGDNSTACSGTGCGEWYAPDVSVIATDRWVTNNQ